MFNSGIGIGLKEKSESYFFKWLSFIREHYSSIENFIRLPGCKTNSLPADSNGFNLLQAY
jgi:hypothetical protein